MSYIKVLESGIWSQNPIIRGVIGLCPLVAVSVDIKSSILLAIMTSIVLGLAMLLISIFQNLIEKTSRIIFFVMIISIFTLMIELVLRAFYYEYYQKLGIYVPLIITNCILLARAESFAKSNAPMLSLVDGISFGAGFGIAIVALAVVRTLLAEGFYLGKGVMFFRYPVASLFVLAIFFFVFSYIRDENLTSHTK